MKNSRLIGAFTIVGLSALAAIAVTSLPLRRWAYTGDFVASWRAEYAAAESRQDADPFFTALSRAALERTKVRVRYDGAYVKIPYPMGDVPSYTGVCSDEIVRVYRENGIDLQERVHEDMASRFAEYPQLWGRRAPDSNIDHRRVPNLMEFFRRFGTSLPVVHDPSAYSPGDMVVWKLSNGLLHIGWVVDRRSSDGARPLIVHNIGAGPRLEDALYVGEIIAHFRYKPAPKSDPERG